VSPGGASRPPLATTIIRGARLRCPKCGARGLFSAYLKLSPACAACGADFSRTETADVAPYVTVFVLGLVLTPLTLILTLVLGVEAPWILALLLTGALAATLLLLPRVKGVLAALLWRAQREM
jgi:uncharacterized protein (DUF983 family)